MSDLTPEELALLAASAATPEATPAPAARRARPVRRSRSEDTTPPTDRDRGPHSPAQFADDGWGDLPVQMRG